MGQDLLSLKNVAVKYEQRKGRWKFEQFWALKDISFTIKQGEVVGIIGRNGAGKSTLLKLLAGIYKPDKGQLEKFRDYKATLLALNVGLVAQLSGRDNVVLGAMLLGLKKSEAVAIIDEVKAYSELGDFFEQPVMTYSSGMKARLGFSVAYYANPELILIDEALGVGDKGFREKSNEAIKEKIRQEDTTVVIVSHAMATIRELCTKVIWIENGAVYRMGEPKEILDAYGDN